MTTRLPSGFEPKHGDAAAAVLKEQLRGWLAGVTFGPSHTASGLEFVPLIGTATNEPAPLLMAEAIRAEHFDIGEHGGGTVNTIVAVNRGKCDVLILEGESIVGAKQNRVVTMDVLMAAGTTVHVPVGCVERGRWDARFAKFESSDTVLEPGMRSNTVSEMSSQRSVDQGRLWAQVGDKLKSAQVSSRTEAYHEFYATKSREVHAKVQALPTLPGQVGVMALADGRLVGLDAFAHERHWRVSGERFVSSYVIEAMSVSSDPRATNAGEAAMLRMTAQQWLTAISCACQAVRPSAGLGVRLTLEDDGLVGAALWHKAMPAHLSAFGVASRMPRRPAGRWVLAR